MDLDWKNLFALSMPAAEIIVRGSAIYLFIFFVFRFVIRRDVGAVGLADILLLVLVADASQNAMSAEYKSIGDGMVLVSVLVAWNLLFDRLSYHFKAFRRFAEPGTLCLVKNGRFLRRNMRRELISEDELWAKLRQNGIESLDQVKAVYLEADGAFSVIEKKH